MQSAAGTSEATSADSIARHAGATHSPNAYEPLVTSVQNYYPAAEYLCSALDR